MNKTQAAAFLGVPENEIVDVVDSPVGPCITTTDGNTIIDVKADEPDGEGKTGLMFLTAPAVDGREYTGGFPVYTPVDADDPVEVEEVLDLSTLTRPQLIAHGAALKPKVVLTDSMSKPKMLGLLADAALAAALAGIDDAAD